MGNLHFNIKRRIALISFSLALEHLCVLIVVATDESPQFVTVGIVPALVRPVELQAVLGRVVVVRLAVLPTLPFELGAIMPLPPCLLL